MRRVRLLAVVLLAGALIPLAGCSTRDSARAKYWSSVEKQAAAGGSARRPMRYSQAKRGQESRPKSYRQDKRSKSRGEGKLAASHGFLEWVLEHGWLVRVKPWERDLLALEEMGWEPDALQVLRRSHIYFSKESSLGGGSAGGGGCGCN